MDPTQLVDEALRRFTALQLATRAGDVVVAGTPDAQALRGAFQHLAKLDGWAKIALDRLVVDPENARAVAELKTSMEHAVRLHPQFMRTLSAACAASGAGTSSARTRAPGQS